MPKMTRNNMALIASAITKLEALCDTRPGVECRVGSMFDNGAAIKDAVRPYLQSWVIPLLERALDEEPIKLYKDRDMIVEALGDLGWRERGAVRCECGQRGAWQHAHGCRFAKAHRMLIELHNSRTASGDPWGVYLPVHGDTRVLPLSFDNLDEAREVARFLKDTGKFENVMLL